MAGCNRHHLAGRLHITLAVVAAASLFANPADAQVRYESAQEAYSAGAKLYKMRKFAEAREPFEAALELSDDDRFKVRVYRALLASYRELPEIDKMLDASEFLLEHSESAAARSLVARNLTAFLHQRGKTQEVAKIYEGWLEDDPNDRTALYILTRIYDRAQPNPTRRQELLEVLEAVQREDETVLAEKFERLASQQPKVATRHWKDAATAWLRAGQVEKALNAVQQAEETGPESTNDLLAHQWHRGMGDVYFELDKPELAIPHYEQAIEKTTIPGYIKDCQEKLDAARSAADS